MIARLKHAAKASRLLNFNLVNRDAWIARQAATLPMGARVLDVGAGSCPYRSLFSHCVYKTQDFAQLDQSQLRDGGYGKIDYVGPASRIPVADGSFDAILCSEVLEHVPDPVQVLGEFARILRTGAKVILTAPLGSGIHQEPYHYYGGFTPFWYQKFLRLAGFVDVHVEANAGSFAFYAQESIRFVRNTRPFRLPLPLLATIVWFPVWLLLAPILGLVAPLLCLGLDRFDREQRFTVGYHVTAIRSASR
jgi:ubiquinone/menaquinone biosynthesis C-methylase UbiE